MISSMVALEFKRQMAKEKDLIMFHALFSEV